jgi:Spy/CpxP family protein refolding chaperone
MLKKFILTLATVALATASAQPGPGRGHGGGTPPTPEQMIERRIEHLTLLLTLTPSQQTQARTIFTDEGTAATALRTQVEQAQTNLRTAVESRLSDAQIDAAAAQVGLLHGQMAAIRGKAQAKFLGILTAEQRDKLSKLGPGMGMGGPGMGGPGRPGGFGRGPGGNL